MVGHTGDMEATTRACALVDSCVKELLAAVDAVGGRWLVRHSRGAWWRVAWQGAPHARPGRLALPCATHARARCAQCIAAAPA